MPFDLKDYEPVEDRLRDFWRENPDGRILTELVLAEAGEYIVKALVWRNATLVEGELGKVLRTDLPDATGLAQETAGSSVVNKTSALENCETSAIGRALANLGYAAKGKRPSREEMSKTSPAAGPAASPTAAAGEATTASASADAAGDPQSPLANGEVTAATMAPGEESPVRSPASPGATNLGPDRPGPPHYPFRPEDCDHKNERTSHLLRPRKSPRGPVCPRCGLSYITVTESTTADLGSA